MFRLHEGVGYPGTRVTDSCELLCRDWELSLGPLEEQPVLLTAEPSLQCLVFLFICLYSRVKSLNLQLVCTNRLTYDGCVHLEAGN